MHRGRNETENKRNTLSAYWEILAFTAKKLHADDFEPFGIGDGIRNLLWNIALMPIRSPLRDFQGEAGFFLTRKSIEYVSLVKLASVIPRGELRESDADLHRFHEVHCGDPFRATSARTRISLWEEGQWYRLE